MVVRCCPYWQGGLEQVRNISEEDEAGNDLYAHDIYIFQVTFAGAEGMLSLILSCRVKCGLEPSVCFYPLEVCFCL